MTNLAKLKSDRAQDAELRQMRVDLAAAFRLAAAMNWHESVGNHFSLAVSPDGKKFLMNPRWKHFSLITMVEVKETIPGQDAVEAAAQRQPSHVGDDPLVIGQAAPAQGYHRRRRIDAGHMQAALMHVLRNRPS